MNGRTVQADVDRATDAVLSTSRGLVAIAARSLSVLDDHDVTLPQYRALVVLASRGAMPSGDLAEELHVHRSTVTRMVDRLVDKDLAERSAAEDRREVVVGVSSRGARLVHAVTTVRRTALARVIENLSPLQRRHVVDGFAAFALAAGEVPDDEWSIVLSPRPAP